MSVVQDTFTGVAFLTWVAKTGTWSGILTCYRCYSHLYCMVWTPRNQNEHSIVTLNVCIFMCITKRKVFNTQTEVYYITQGQSQSGCVIRTVYLIFFKFSLTQLYLAQLFRKFSKSTRKKWTGEICSVKENNCRLSYSWCPELFHLWEPLIL